MKNQELLIQAFLAARRAAEIMTNLAAQEKASTPELKELLEKATQLNSAALTLYNRSLGEKEPT